MSSAPLEIAGILIQVVDPAIPPDKRSFPKHILIVLGAIAAGFLVGIFAVLLQAGLQKLRDDSDLSSKLDELRQPPQFGDRRPAKLANELQ